MEFFRLNVLLKVFLFLKVCDRDQVELEAMVLDYPKFHNHEYCSLVVIFRAGQVHKLVRKSANPQLRTNEKSCGHEDLRTLAA